MAAFSRQSFSICARARFSEVSSGAGVLVEEQQPRPAGAMRCPPEGGRFPTGICTARASDVRAGAERCGWSWRGWRGQERLRIFFLSGRERFAPFFVARGGGAVRETSLQCGREGWGKNDASLPRGARICWRCAGSTLFAPAGQKRFRVGAPDFGLPREKTENQGVLPIRNGWQARRENGKRAAIHADLVSKPPQAASPCSWACRRLHAQQPQAE